MWLLSLCFQSLVVRGHLLFPGHLFSFQCNFKCKPNIWFSNGSFRLLIWSETCPERQNSKIHPFLDCMTGQLNIKLRGIFAFKRHVAMLYSPLKSKTKPVFYEHILHHVQIVSSSRSHVHPLNTYTSFWNTYPDILHGGRHSQRSQDILPMNHFLCFWISGFEPPFKPS
jgi:hypothetical protein